MGRKVLVKGCGQAARHYSESVRKVVALARNPGPRAIAPDQLITIMNDAVRELSARLPEESQSGIADVVYEVTTELVSTITDPARLSSMLRLRAAARLRARAGHPVPIRRN